MMLKLREIELTGVLCPKTKKYHHYDECVKCEFCHLQIVNSNGRIIKIECTYQG